jgi:hypothetical protein
MESSGPITSELEKKFNKLSPNKPLYRKCPVFWNELFRRILGILYILQTFVSSSSLNSAFSNTALPALKFNRTICPFWKLYSVPALGLHFYYSPLLVVMATKTRVVLDLNTRVIVIHVRELGKLSVKQIMKMFVQVSGKLKCMRL